MRLTHRRVLAAASLSLAIGGAASALSANAAATDVAAITSNASEFASDSLSNAVQPSDNLSCNQPTAGGVAVVQATNAVVAQVFGEDEAVAQIACASLTPSVNYTLTGTLYIQAFYSGAWHTVATSGLRSVASKEGATALPITLNGRYDPPSVALGAYHRALVIYQTSTGRHYRIPSPSVWYMNK